MKTFGSIALNFVAMVLLVLVVALCLWLLVPAAFPALGFTFLNAVGASGLLFVAKAVFS